MSYQDPGMQVAAPPCPPNPPSPPPVPVPTDVVLATLTQAVSGVVAIAADKDKAKKLSKELAHYLASQLPPPPPQPGEDTSTPLDPVIAPAAGVLKVGLATAKNAFHTAEGTAAAELNAAVLVWDLAVVQYQSAQATALAALSQAVTAAKDTYTQKFNKDSQSRNLFLYFTMEAEVDAAAVTYESAMATAAAALAAAAGTLMEAFTTYMTGTASLEAVRLNAVATANETFWQSVESIRDSV
jgi:hypothetical protein